MHDAEGGRKMIVTINQTNEHTDNNTNNTGRRKEGRARTQREGTEGAWAIVPVVKSDAALGRGIYTKSGRYIAER